MNRPILTGLLLGAITCCLFWSCERRTNPFDAGGENYDPPVYQARFHLQQEYLGNPLRKAGTFHYRVANAARGLDGNLVPITRTIDFGAMGFVDAVDTVISDDFERSIYVDSVVIPGLPVARFQSGMSYTSSRAGNSYELKLTTYDTITISIGYDSLRGHFFRQLDSTTILECLFDTMFYTIEYDTGAAPGIVIKDMFSADTVVFKYFRVKPNPFSYSIDGNLWVTISMKDTIGRWKFDLDQSKYKRMMVDSTGDSLSDSLEYYTVGEARDYMYMRAAEAPQTGGAVASDTIVITVDSLAKFNDAANRIDPARAYDLNSRLIFPWIPLNENSQPFKKDSYFLISYSDSIFVAERIFVLP